MNFKKLEVYGFKSFADKLEVDFKDGITGIVGPNGCGKSNVADSVRWVLGEQSARILRGKTMQDVIFNGTEKRRSLSFCEVSLHFDNTNRIFPIEYDEVVISRKLYRSGESEYSLNRNQCKLKDIVDLLHDTGIGKEGYCIVGQGKIDEILSAKPDDRRGIFEEAAGISKFKTRKVEAERKLERVRDNMARTEDALVELKRQIGPLAQQAEDARLYLEIRDKLKYNEVNAYLYRYDNASDMKREIGERLNGIMEEISLRETERDRAGEEYNACFEAISRADEETARLRDEHTNLMVNAEKMLGEGKLMGERILNLKQESTRLEGLIAKLKTDLDTKSQLLTAAVEARGEIAGKIAGSEDDLQAAQKVYDDIFEEITAYEKEVEASNTLILESMNELGDIKENLGRFQAEQESLGDRIKDHKAKIADLTAERNSLTEGVQKAEGEIRHQENIKQKLDSEKLRLIAKNNELQAQVIEETEQYRILQGRVSALGEKYRMLEEMRRDYDGYSYSVKRLLQDSESDPYVKRLIDNVVAKVINVPDKYQVAIETALGNRLQYVVTASENEAKELIEYVKKNRYGRITCLPLTSYSGSLIENNAVLRERGVIGIASEIIGYDKKYLSTVRGLLGKTLIVDTLDTAIYVSRAYNKAFRIVALDGEIIEPSGAISGGSRKSDSTSLLSRERQINETAEALEKSKADFEEVSESLVEHREDLTNAALDIESCKEKINVVLVSIATEREKLDKLHTGVADMSAEIEKLTQEAGLFEARRTAIIEQIKRVDSLKGEINKQHSDSNEFIEKRKNEYEEMRARREAATARLTEIRSQLAALNAELASKDGEIVRLKGECTAISSEITESTSGLAIVSAKIQRTEQDALNTNLSEEERARLDKIKAEIAGMDEKKKALNARLIELDSKKSEAITALSQAMDRKYKEDGQLAKIDLDIDAMQTRIWEEYHLTYSTAISLRDDAFDFTGSAQLINKLKKQAQDIGYVNVRAIEDHKAVLERYEDRMVQLNDLTTAESDLVSIITELTNEMVTRFRDQFDKINANFGVIFKELFGGGVGKLVLDDSVTDDPLEAGIEILAEPPGKKLQSISLLSGGERALTAIAILFAIIKLRPMPFCILDEIEAALDDSNAKLFASYLRRFSRDTQFIVITHRKPTMELADCLYGVTMQEKGVSKIVSVNLSDAVKSAEPQK